MWVRVVIVGACCLYNKAAKATPSPSTGKRVGRGVLEGVLTGESIDTGCARRK